MVNTCLSNENGYFCNNKVRPGSNNLNLTLQVNQFLIFISVIMNIFVANLSFKMRDDQLRKVFEPFGEVESVRIITDRNSGRSRGYGFVVMPNDGEATTAISKLNDMEVEGRKLVVKASEERSEPKRFTGRRE